MKNTIHKISWIPAALATFLLSVGATPSQALPLEIGKDLETAPITIQGQSGGTVDSKDCGFIAETPNQVINLSEPLDYMRLSVESTAGQATLLVDGPDGRFCVLGDSVSGENPQISGFWTEGTYRLYVGDRTGGQHAFTLSISPKNNPAQ